MYNQNRSELFLSLGRDLTAHFLRNIQLYLLQKWGDARKEFERIPGFTTQGRKSNIGYPKKARDYGADYAIVNPLSRKPVTK
ncbi:hypothetical protein BBH88_17785 [Planococcus antarcticus DSM 14505]|uniref:Transposase n=1 Tax=Planococcus antarcticus DSM 14505 TaxID=1185653 RepID=A0ABM6D994_9BACL|nr:hypothetical protein [Planococcus antarcticus]ANU11972.1 hypothetical protein BBH88_17785 [Planococcus antarcticus DSM 14505]